MVAGVPRRLTLKAGQWSITVHVPGQSYMYAHTTLQINASHSLKHVNLGGLDVFFTRSLPMLREIYRFIQTHWNLRDIKKSDLKCSEFTPRTRSYAQMNGDANRQTLSSIATNSIN